MTAFKVGRAALAIPILTSLCWAASAHAVTVVIGEPANPSGAMAETVVRVRGELLAAGFAVEIVDATLPDGIASRSSLERLAEPRAADAVVALVGDSASPPTSVQVWAIDKVTGRSVMSSLPFEVRSVRSQETLAIRAIELLRSSFLEIDLTANGRRKDSTLPPPPAVDRPAELEGPASRPERIGVALGGAGVTGFDRIGSYLSPLAELCVALGARFVIVATASGFGTRPSVAAALGSAQVSQEFVTLGGVIRFRDARRVRPFLTLSAGGLHTSVEGRAADAINQGRDQATWSFLLDGGAGATVPLRDRLYVSLALHGQMAEPYPAIHFLDDVVATSAHPNLLLTLTLGAWL